MLARKDTDDMDDGEVNYIREVNYYETDSMGIVHHSNYIRFFEEARLALLRSVLMDYAELEKKGIIIPVTFVECKYLFPLRFGDKVIIKAHLSKYTGIKMEVSYRIFNSVSHTLCTTGTTGHCFLGTDRKPLRMKKEFPEIYRKLKEAILDTEKEKRS